MSTCFTHTAYASSPIFGSAMPWRRGNLGGAVADALVGRRVR